MKDVNVRRKESVLGNQKERKKERKQSREIILESERKKERKKERKHVKVTSNVRRTM